MDNIDQLKAQKEQLEQLEKLKREILVKCLTKEARERLANVRIGNPQLAEQVEYYLIQVYQQGQLKEAITDSQLKDLLKTLTQKRETKTTIKRK